MSSAEQPRGEANHASDEVQAPSGARLRTDEPPIAAVGPTMPADYLAVGKDNVAYPLRVQLIEHRGLPDRFIESAEDQPPGHYGPDSRLRPKIDSMLERAADVLIAREHLEHGSGNGNGSTEEA